MLHPDSTAKLITMEQKIVSGLEIVSKVIGAERVCAGIRELFSIVILGICSIIDRKYSKARSRLIPSPLGDSLPF